jgi:hypothetical protein
MNPSEAKKFQMAMTDAVWAGAPAALSAARRLAHWCAIPAAVGHAERPPERSGTGVAILE